MSKSILYRDFDQVQKDFVENKVDGRVYKIMWGRYFDTYDVDGKMLTFFAERTDGKSEIVLNNGLMLLLNEEHIPDEENNILLAKGIAQNPEYCAYVPFAYFDLFVDLEKQIMEEYTQYSIKKLKEMRAGDEMNEFTTQTQKDFEIFEETFAQIAKKRQMVDKLNSKTLDK